MSFLRGMPLLLVLPRSLLSRRGPLALEDCGRLVRWRLYRVAWKFSLNLLLLLSRLLLLLLLLLLLFPGGLLMVRLLLLGTLQDLWRKLRWQSRVGSLAVRHLLLVNG